MSGQIPLHFRFDILILIGHIFNEPAHLSFFEEPVLNFQSSSLQDENVVTVLKELKLLQEDMLYQVLARHLQIKPSANSSTDLHSLLDNRFRSLCNR